MCLQTESEKSLPLKSKAQLFCAAGEEVSPGRMTNPSPEKLIKQNFS